MYRVRDTKLGRDVALRRDPVAANAGTFEVSGNTLTLRPTVAKNTFPMVPGFFNEYEFTLDGDTLVTTWTRSSYGPISNPLITRLTRAR